MGAALTATSARLSLFGLCRYIHVPYFFAGLRLIGLCCNRPQRTRAKARQAGYCILPLGLFPGAFDRRAAGVLVSPELPPGYYPVDKSRGIEPSSRRCLTSTSEPELNRHFFESGGYLPAGGQSPQFWPLQHLVSRLLF